MAYRLIGQDAAVTIEFSTLAAAGQAPVYSGGGNVLTLTGSGGAGSEITVTDDLETVNVAGIGDTRQKLRAKRGKTTITIKKYVASTGAIAGATGVIGALTGSKLGFYAQVKVKELSSLGSYVTYEGLVTKFELSMPDEAEIENITIECDAEHS